MHKLKTHTALSLGDEEALLRLPHRTVSLRPGGVLFSEGERYSHCAVMLDGFMSRHKILPSGSIQIVAIHLRGDGLDLQNALLVEMDHSVQALTAAQVALVPAGDVRSLILGSPSLAMAIWIETLIDTSIQREWTVNVGRRDARARIAHVLCELGMRQEGAGLSQRDSYPLPINQEQLADATGLTPVHVNRVLRSLTEEGLIARDKRSLRIPSWDALAEAGQFTPDYLHPMQNAV